MKTLKLSTLVLAAALALASCDVFATIGNGDIVSRDLSSAVDPAAGFRSVELLGSGRVLFALGTDYTVSVSTDSNIVDAVKVEVKAGELELGLDSGFLEAKLPTSLVFTVTAPAVDSAAVAGSGSIEFQGGPIAAGNLKLLVAGSGSISGAFDAATCDIDVAGSGWVKGAISADSCSAYVAGSGYVDFDAPTSAPAALPVPTPAKTVADCPQGSSPAGIGALDARVDGSGFILGYEVPAASVAAVVSGSGFIEVNCSTKLEAAVYGSGHVSYSGNPAVTRTVLGSGWVSPK